MVLLEKEWYIEAPWGRLCIIAWGDCCDPPVLVCHGAKDSAASFRPLIKLLPKKFYYIGLELPGNGRSDRMPGGLMLGLHDLVYSLQVLVKHFRWDSFVYLGHSMGCSLGYIYNISYPGKISKIIQLDPITMGFAVPADRFPLWYKMAIARYFENYERYNRSNNDKRTYTREEAIDKIMKRRGFTEEVAVETLVRVTEPAGDGLIRFTFDERVNLVTYPPMSPEYLRKLFTEMTIPILTIIAEESKNRNRYKDVPFVFDEDSFPNKNHRWRALPGGHDLHANNADIVATIVAPFLLHGVAGLDNKSKL
ncbi:serine hydrolase-like protein 2 [Bicyclus anynana]|uniref:Serine hydrolase-like protein 2 n=1 Tax=Bicyclus anynana TaxID=110368 RepID=A0ABM3M325_BICAN|nr:serine hydrolase-like protein 2 [Bicyclus anynana]